jgi:hypothetical protein
MFLAVRILVRIAALATLLVVISTALVVVSTAPPASAASRPPTSGQIRLAIRHAERPGVLWATVNICNTRRYPGRLGIRGQMPSLGFPASMSMNIQVDYLSQANRRFKPIPGASRAIRFTATTGLHQEGANWRFTPHTGTLSATITFTWSLGRKVLARTARAVTAGHPDADFGDPPHFSAAQCKI